VVNNAIEGMVSILLQQYAIPEMSGMCGRACCRQTASYPPPVWSRFVISAWGLKIARKIKRSRDRRVRLLP
jgi:hypothetical protein